jgi:1,4-alpha-glucan branching enzyme
MGGEIAQEREWNHDAALDWPLLDDPAHAGMQRLVRDLNHAMRDVPALHRRDASPEGFAWTVGDDSTNSVFAFLRFGDAGDPPALVVSNFTPVPRRGYRIGVPAGGRWAERVNTDRTGYGGSGIGNPGGAVAEAVPAHGRAQSVSLDLPPLATLILLPDRP